MTKTYVVMAVTNIKYNTFGYFLTLKGNKVWNIFFV